MKDLSENHVIRFKNLTKKKDSIYANFQVKGIRGGVVITSSISVDIAELNVLPSDSLEKIIETSANRAIKEFKSSEFHLEDFSRFQDEYLGVAQLG